MGRGGGGSGGSHGGGGGHFHYGSSRGGGSRSTGGGRSYGGYSGERGYGGGYRRPYYGGGSYGPSFGRRPPIVYRSPFSYVFLGGLPWLLLILILLLSFFGGSSAKSSIQTSTIERTKLGSQYVQLSDTWYEDELDWIHDKPALEKGLKSFYEATGVQPYLWITDNINGDPRPDSVEFEQALKEKYQKLFSDEGHVIVCFMESSPSVYATYYWAGSAAKSVLDEEAGEILLDYIDVNYTSDMSDEAFFSVSFQKAGEAMMKTGRTTKQLMLTGAIVFGLAAVLFLGIRFLIYKTSYEKQKAETTKEILNTPVEDIAESVLEKYKGDE